MDNENIEKLYNYFLWFNPYENVWYGIESDSVSNFFGGKRKSAKYFKSTSEDEVKQQIYKS